MVSLPHNTVLCKKPISSSLPQSLSLYFFPALLFSFFSTLLICDSLISLLFQNTGRIHTAGFSFTTTISHCSGVFADVFHSAQVPRTVLIKSAYWEFLLNSKLKMTFSSPLLLCCTERFVTGTWSSAPKKSLKFHPKPSNVWLRGPVCTYTLWAECPYGL